MLNPFKTVRNHKRTQHGNSLSMLLKPKVSSKLKKSQVKTSNVEFLKLVVAESEDINTR